VPFPRSNAQQTWAFCAVAMLSSRASWPFWFGLFGSRTAWHPSDAARRGLDRQYLFEFSSSGPQDLGDAAVFGRRHANIGGEEASEAALRGEAEIEADVGDRRFRCDQRVERLLHHQRVEIEVRGDAGLGAEQAVEMRPRQPGFPSNRIELELGARTLRHQLDGFADTKVGDRYGRCPRFLRGPSGLPAFLVAAVDQLPQFAVETTQRGGTADQSCRASDVLVQGGGSREAGSAEPKA